MASTDLKDQFQLLQQQQQQKLLERRRKKEESSLKAGDIPGKLDGKDNLDLKLADHSEKGYGYLSEELVDHLNNEIRKLKDENGRLLKLVNEKDFEIKQVRKKIEEKKDFSLDGPVTNETAATKIVELSKRVRELTAEKESEKTKSKQLMKKCIDLQKQADLNSNSSLTSSSIRNSTVSLFPSSENREEDKSEIKSLQEKLKQSEYKLSELRNQSQQLKLELKVAQKVLSQEIGENVNIHSLLNETSQWRGRAQQIIALQQKVEELKIQLENQTLEEKSSTDKSSTGRRKQDEKYRDELRRLEKERKEAQENSVTKAKQLEEDNASLKQKLDASKTRSKVLSNEVKSLKAQVETLLRKSHNDDEFIEALMKQQEQLKNLLQQNSAVQSQQQMQQQQRLQELSVKSQQDNNIVEQLKAIAAQKEAQVKLMAMELETLKSTHNKDLSSLGSVNSDDTTSPRSGRASAVTDEQSNNKEEDTGNPLFSRKSSSHSASKDRKSSRFGFERGKSSLTRTNTPVSSQEKNDLQYQYQELEVMSRAAEVEKDKMAELVKVLQARLADETQKSTDMQLELKNYKRQTVELEKMLGRQNIDGKRKGTAKATPSSTDLEESGDIDVDELMTRVEIQKDENDSLKTALQKTLKAKEDDLKIYSTTLEETKQVFLQALRQMKNKS